MFFVIFVDLFFFFYILLAYERKQICIRDIVKTNSNNLSNGHLCNKHDIYITLRKNIYMKTLH